MNKLITILILVSAIACTREKVVVIDTNGNEIKPKTKKVHQPTKPWGTNEYVTFEIEGHKYIYGDHYRSSYMAHAGLGDCLACTQWIDERLNSICK